MAKGKTTVTGEPGYWSVPVSAGQCWSVLVRAGQRCWSVWARFSLPPKTQSLRRAKSPLPHVYAQAFKRSEMLSAGPLGSATGADATTSFDFKDGCAGKAGDGVGAGSSTEGEG